MKNIIFSTILIIASNLQINAQEYEEPQWKIPLCFEDATGAKDTVWLGYDPNAHSFGYEMDTLFGEKWEWIDTSQFNVYLNYKYTLEPTVVYLDSVMKIDISSWPLMLGSDIRITHGVLPVTLKWDEGLLNSPKLPSFYPDITPRPRARIDLSESGFDAEDDFIDCDIMVDGAPEIILTGYITAFPTCECAFSDSLVFNECTYVDELSDYCAYMYCSIAPHDYDYFEYIEKHTDAKLLVYPTQVKDIVNINNIHNNELFLSVYDIQGRCLLTKNYKKSNIQLDLSIFKSGLYILQIKTGYETYTYKINKI